jgi:hypothetical protein
MITKYRISHFLYEVAPMMLDSFTQGHKAPHHCSSGSLCWPSPIDEHVSRGFSVADPSAGTCGEP